MQITPLTLPGAALITLAPRGDERGYFMRVYDEAIYAAHGLQTRWVQENQSRSVHRHILRGLHFQRPPHAETKLVRCVQGAILDVFVDLRRASPTFGRWQAVELTADIPSAVYVPKGFAHGFCTLTDEVVIHYKVDAPYCAEAEIGLRWDALGIDWPTRTPQLSAKDATLPDLDEVVRRLADTPHPFPSLLT